MIISRQLVLLTWKNFLIQGRHYKILICELVICIALLMFIQIMHYPFRVRSAEKQVTYNSYPLTKVPILNGKLLVYLPKNPIFEEIVKSAAVKLNMRTYGVDRISGVEEALEIGYENEEVAAGIILEEKYKDMEELPKIFSFILAFPNIIRTATSENVKDNLWHTITYNIDDKPLITDSDDDIYISEGFVVLQHEMFNAYFEMATKEFQSELNEKQLYSTDKVALNAFPMYVGNVRQYYPMTKQFIEFIILVQNFMPFLYVVWIVGRDLEKNLKIYVRMYEVPFWTHWVSHFIAAFIHFLILNLLAVFFLKSSLIAVDGIFSRVHVIELFVFLTFYSTNVILFAFVITSFVKNSKQALLLSAIVWLSLFSIFAYLIEDTYSINYLILLTFLYMNNILTYAISLLYEFDARDLPVQWFEFNYDRRNQSFGFASLMLVVNIFFYSIILYYIEVVHPGSYVPSKSWSFPCAAIFKCCRKKKKSPTVQFLLDLSDDVIEKRVDIGIAALKLHRVQAIRNGRLVLSNLSINIFEGEITTFYGHNGSGKTTALLIIAGIITPDEGNVFLFNKDLHKSKIIQMSIGICPSQNDVLFNELTVYEHLQLFCKLKGVPKSKIVSEISYCLNLLKNEEITNAMVGKLSYDDQRLLCLAIAFCGQSKIIILDEPTQYMTVGKRRQFWDILHSEKKNRIIILATHCNEEANISDRIAFMSKGVLKCFGSSVFLKQRFGTGYNLILVKGKDFNLTKVTDILKAYGIHAENDIGNEITYKIPIDDKLKMSNIMMLLEKRQQELSIYSITLIEPSLYDAYTNLGMEKNKQLFYEKSASRIHHVRMLPPKKRIQPQIQGIMYKKLIFFSPNLIPVIIAVFAIFVILFMQSVSHYSANRQILNTPIELVYLDFSSAEVYAVNNVKEDDPTASYHLQLFKEYVNSLKSETNIIEFDDKNLADVILEEYKQKNQPILSVGASFHDDQLVAWFNPMDVGSSALSLTILHNIILKNAFNKDFGTKVVNFPFSLPIIDEIYIHKTFGGNMVLATCIGVTFPILTCSFIMFIISEKESNFKDIQLLAGLKLWIYWIFGLLWDYMTHLFLAIIYTYCILFIPIKGFDTHEKLVLFLVFGAYIFSALCFVYLLSICFNSVIDGMLITLLCSICIGALAYSLCADYQFCDTFLLRVLVVVSPFYTLMKAIESIYYINIVRNICLRETQLHGTPNAEICRVSSEECCNTDFFQWRYPGLLWFFLYFFLSGLAYLIILIARDYIIESRKYDRLNVDKLYPFCSKDFNKDVIAVKQKICNLTNENLCKYNFVVDQLEGPIERHKTFHTISFALKSSKCIAILGAKKSNKTELSKKLIGLQGFSYGDIYVAGMDFKTCHKDVLPKLGYCFQKGGVIDHCSCRDYLLILCMISGVEKSQISPFIQELIDGLALRSMKNKKIWTLTQGQYRRLNIAASLIADIDTLIIDDPTADIDPTSSREILNILRYIRYNGKSIVCLTNNAYEATALADKVILYVDHTMIGFASTEILRQQFCNGVNVEFQLSPRGENMKDIEENYKIDLRNLREFIKELSPNAVFRNEYCLTIRFFLPLRNVVWSKLFLLLESEKERLSIANYLIGEENLQEILLRLSDNRVPV